MKKYLPYIFLFIVLFVIGFLISQREDQSENSVKRTQILLGTLVEIQIKDIKEQAADSLISLAFDEIRRIDSLFSTYNKNGSVYKINISKDSIIQLPDETFHLITLSDSLWRITEGAFDVSLNELIEAWGFDTDNPVVPSKKIIKDALKHSGWENIEILNSNKVKRRNDVEFNFGAIAKGYAVDKAIEILKEKGVEKALINAGGEIKGLGNGWIVGVQHPRVQNHLIAKIKLNGKSVATSGDYENYFFENDKRYHHILNPETGYPSRGLQSVTVLANSDTFADAISTVVFVMGKGRGMNFIESLENVEAMFVDDYGEIYYSNGFGKYLVE